MRAYYNEISEPAAATLRELIASDVIAPGDVDTRSIKDVQPDDLRPYTQCHFFAGGGLWSVAARLAGWPDDRSLWTGSCPCQPFSVAGRGEGVDDPRHLWPDFFRLIRATRPAVVMGEQVAGKAGYGWLDGVRADLAGEGYASRGVDIPACAVDAPHIRSRLYWIASNLADAVRPGRDASAYAGVCGGKEGAGPRHGEPQRLHGDDLGGSLVDTESDGRGEGRAEPEVRSWGATTTKPDASSVRLGHPDRQGLAVGRSEPGDARPERAPAQRADGRNGSWWADAEWIVCHDGKARRTQPGTSLLVDGLFGRVDLWSIAGNAISPILAAEVIAAFMDTTQEQAP